MGQDEEAGPGLQGRKRSMGMDAKGFFEGLPWWVKWVVIPVVALALFGGLIASVVGFLVGVLFKVLLFVLIVGAVIFLVRKFTSASSSSRGDW